MTSTRLIELEMAANAHPGNRSSAMILELVEAVRELQKRKAKRASFVAPSVEAVQEYFAEGEVFRNGTAAVKAAEFIAFYSARGWRLSKGVPMVCWKSACDLWESNARQKAVGPALNRSVPSPRL